MDPVASERRTVAVLFADLSGFTRLAERMDPEDVQELVGTLFSRFRSRIESLGGSVDKFIGDAVMALFGAPIAHGDDAVRAVRAALALLEEVRSLNAERHLDLAVRAGVNIGEVLWGSLAGDRPTAMGDAVNVAQRLESAAEPGSVLVSEAVEREARRAIRFRGPQEMSVKGRGEKVTAFVALEELSGETEVRGGAPAPFAGRDTELLALIARLEAGPGGVVIVEGEAGAGKSRLMAELRRVARSRAPGGWVTAGRSLESRVVPLAPLGEIVRSEAGAGAGADAGAKVASRIEADLRGAGKPPIDAENAGQLVALSCGFELPGARVGAMEASRFGEAAQRAWEDWLQARAGGGPALLCMEDLHWADAGTLALLARLAARLAGTRILVVASSRGGVAIPGAEITTLGGLPGESVARIVEGSLGRRAAPELVTWIAGASGGNPLYVEELTQHLDKGGFLSGIPARMPAPIESLPTGILGLLVARLDALPAPQRETLKAASVFGRAFWPGLVPGLLERDSSADVAAAREAGLLLPRSSSILPGEPELLFRHALLREAAYSLLPKRDRRRLHGKAAGMLEARIAGAGRSVRVAAADHRAEAGELDAAARLWRAAGKEAFMTGCAAESLEIARRAARAGAAAQMGSLEAFALRHLGKSAESLEAARSALADPGVSSKDLAELHVVSSQALVRLGRFPEALAAADAAEAVCPEPRTVIDGARAAVVVLTRLGKYQESHDRGTRALRGCPDAGADPDLQYSRTLLRAVLATVEGHLGRNAEALATYREILPMFRKLGHRQGLATALINTGVLLIETDTAEAIACHREAAEILRETGDRSSLASALANIGNLETAAGHHDIAIATLREAAAIHEDLGEPDGIGLTASSLGAALASAGRLQQALVSLEQSVGQLTSIGNVRLAAGFATEAAATAWLLGLEAQGDRWFEISAASWKSLGVEAEARQFVFRAMELRLRGKFPEAREHLERAQVTGDPRRQQSAMALRLLEMARLDRAEARETALESAQVAVEFSEANPRNSFARPAAALAARIAAEQGRAAESLIWVRRFPAGEESDFEPRMWCLEDLAATHAANGDAEGARRLAERGLKEAEAAGAEPAAARFRAILKSR